MNTILTEKEYQHYIIDYLKDNKGYIIRKNANFDRLISMDKDILMKFLTDTQEEKIEALKKIYKSELNETLFNYINMEMTKNIIKIFFLLQKKYGLVIVRELI